MSLMLSPTLDKLDDSVTSIEICTEYGTYLGNLKKREEIGPIWIFNASMKSMTPHNLREIADLMDQLNTELVEKTRAENPFTCPKFLGLNFDKKAVNSPEQAATLFTDLPKDEEDVCTECDGLGYTYEGGMSMNEEMNIRIRCTECDSDDYDQLPEEMKR